MLTSIRERATGWIAWAIVILITIPFALWGVNSYFTGGVNVNVAQFEGEEIDYQSYQRALYSERERVRQALGGNASAELLSGDVLGRVVVDRLVTEVLLQRDALKQGYRISDEQLAEAIRSEPSFQSEQGFSREQYERILQFSGYSPTEFESVQRNNAATQQIQTGFIESALRIDSNVEDVLKLLLQRRVGEYVIVEPAGFLSEIEVSDAEIRNEYEENQQLYVQDESVRVEFIELDRSNFATNFAPTDETLRQIYDAEAQQFRQEEQRSVSHILLATEEGNNSAALEQAYELLARIRSGEEFSSLAAEYSDDVGSAAQGGSIGWINRGVTAPAFESVAFSLDEGEISDPVESEFGVHIIRIDQIQAEQIKDFEEVRDELAEQAMRNEAESEMFSVAEELRNVAFEQPDSLEPAKDLLGVQTQFSDWFTQTDGTGIAADINVREVAFSDTVLEDGFNSDVIGLEDGRQVVLRKYDHRPAETLDLEVVKAEITEKLLVAKSAQQALEFGENLIEKLRDGASWTATIDQHGLQSSAIPGRTGDPDNLDSAEVAAYVYAWERPGTGGAVYGGGPISGGRFAMFEISDVVEGDIANASEADRENLGNILRLRFGAGLFEGYLTQLKQGIDVDINEDLL